MSNNQHDLETYRFCPECGTQAPDRGKFCGECGRSLLKQVVPNAGQLATPPMTTEMTAVVDPGEDPAVSTGSVDPWTEVIEPSTMVETDQELTAHTEPLTAPTIRPDPPADRQAASPLEPDVQAPPLGVPVVAASATRRGRHHKPDPPAPRGRIASTSMTRVRWVGIAALAGCVVGLLMAWGTDLLASVSGIHTDDGKLFGAVLLLAALLTWLHIIRTSRVIGSLLAIAWLGLLAIAVYEIVHVRSSQVVHVGSGLYVDAAAAAVGTVTVVRERFWSRARSVGEGETVAKGAPPPVPYPASQSAPPPPPLAPNFGPFSPSSPTGDFNPWDEAAPQAASTPSGFQHVSTPPEELLPSEPMVATPGTPSAAPPDEVLPYAGEVVASNSERAYTSPAFVIPVVVVTAIVVIVIFIISR